jgi:hypothetical protein
MIALRLVYTSDPSNLLSDFRALIDRRPEALYEDARVLAHLLRCSEAAVEEARRWVVEDGLEIRA